MRGWFRRFPLLLLSLLLLSTPLIAAGDVLEVYPGFDTLTGSITVAGERDVFPFPAIAGSALTLAVKAGKGEAVLPGVEIWGPDRTPVPGLDAAKAVSKKGNSVKVKKFALPDTGRYYLLITGRNDSTGAYSVKSKLKAPKKVVLSGEITEAGGEATFELPSPGLALAKLTVSADKKWSDGEGPGNLQPNPGDLTSPTGEVGDLGTPKLGKGKFKVGPLALPDFGVYVVRIEAEPATRGGFVVKAGIKAGKRDKRTILDSDILLPPSVDSVEPDVAFIDKTLEDIEVKGTFFQDDATLTFVRGTTGVVIPDAEIVDDETIRFDLDVTTLAIGVWDIVVENGDGGQARLDSAFTVKNVSVTNVSIAPDEGYDDEVVSVRITADRLSGGASVRLFRPTEEIPGQSTVVFAGLGYIDTQFNLMARALGAWDLEVTNLGADPVVVPNAFTILNAPPRVLAFSPDRTHADSGTVQVEILGTGFDEGAAVRMTREGETPFAATDVVVDTENRITAWIDVKGKAAGWWGVTVENTDGVEASKDDVFLVFGTIGDTLSNELDDPAIGPPDIALNRTDHEFLVVWAEKTAGGDYTVRGQRYDIDSWAKVGSMFEIKTGISAEDTTDPRATPAVAWSPDHDRYCVAWVEKLPDQAGTSDQFQIWARIYTNTGSAYSSAVQVTDNTVANLSVLSDHTNGSPDVVYDTDAKSFQICFEHDWDDNSGTDWTHDWDVMMRTVDATGKLDSSLGHFGSGFREDQPAMDWNSNLLKPLSAWRYGDTTASFSGTQIEIGDFVGSSTRKLSTSGTDTDPTVAYAKSGEALIAWVRDDEKIMGLLIDPSDYSDIGSQFTIGGTSGEKVSAPRAVYNPVDNEYLVLWTRETASVLQVVGRRYGKDGQGNGAFLGSAREVSGGSDAEVFGVPVWLPKLDLDDDPETFDVYLMTWGGSVTRSSGDYLSEELLAQRYK